jgi:hypothetical protein
MGAQASSTAGNVAKRAFPKAHRAAAEVIHKKAGTPKGTLEVSRDLPNHLRAAAATSTGKLDPNTLSKTSHSSSTPAASATTSAAPTTASSTNRFDGPLDLDHLSSIVEPGLGTDGTRADTLASGRQASYVEELRDQYVAEMKTKQDPAINVAKMMGEIGPVDSHQEMRAHQKPQGNDVDALVAVQRTGVFTDGFVQLRSLLYEADDIAAGAGNPRKLPLQQATQELSINHGMDEKDIEMILRLHAVPSFVNENIQVSNRPDMNDESSNFEKKWKGYWPSVLDKE